MLILGCIETKCCGKRIPFTALFKLFMSLLPDTRAWCFLFRPCLQQLQILAILLQNFGEHVVGTTSAKFPGELGVVVMSQIICPVPLYRRSKSCEHAARFTPQRMAARWKMAPRTSDESATLSILCLFRILSPFLGENKSNPPTMFSF